MTFSGQVKNEILNAEDKMRKCCSFSFLYGFMINSLCENDRLQQSFTFAKNAETLENICTQLFFKKQNYFCVTKNKFTLNKEAIRFSTIVEIEENVFKCPNCKKSFLKGLFSACGTVCDPNKAYQLELTLNSQEKANDIRRLLEDLGLCPKISLRLNKFVLYFKRSEDIEDFLIHIGAKNSAFDVMNSKINKEIRNTANRITNCDSANINKSLIASKKHVDAIKALIDKNMLDCLPEHLQETARLRLEFIDLSFSDLGLKFNPPVSKSGVYHRLEKILEFYKNLE